MNTGNDSVGGTSRAAPLMNMLPGYSDTQKLREDGGLVYSRGRATANNAPVFTVVPASPVPPQAALERLEREYALKSELDSTWAVRPLALLREQGETMLVLEDAGGTPLDQLLGHPWPIEQFLRVAIGMSLSLERAHQKGIVHKDLKPANVLINLETDEVRLTGFGNATRLPRERLSPETSELISGTLSYMAPEQTGRMNRSVDSRSDLYALGIMLYEMLTGTLPFSATDPIEWIHCHVARTPTPPTQVNDKIPPQISAIVIKLLAKTAEARYQTAAGLAADLEHCLKSWNEFGRVDPFPLAKHDVSPRLLVPEKLYGREQETTLLLEAFERVLTRGSSELLVVSGYSGVGKSSLVNELQKLIVLPRGLFASGKVDQNNRSVPYTTLAQAIRTLVRQILVKPEAEVAHFRQIIQEALGDSGQLITNLVPDLSYLIGEQPAAPDLPPTQAENRFHAVLAQLLCAFARKEHPLALFLDDLQWIDPASLSFLEYFLRFGQPCPLLLLGAYRDSEVTPSHPLMLALSSLRKHGVPVSEITLQPLSRRDVDALVRDSLHCKLDACRDLAGLVYEKTGGNPFFAIQFLTTLEEEGLVEFDAHSGTFRWDMQRIAAKSFTDNVVDLMIAKLMRFSAATQDALKALSCFGNSAELKLLARILDTSEEQTQADLWSAVTGGLLVRTDSSYSFIHDRLQEAAYSLIPTAQRTEAHLRIGRLLQSLGPETSERQLFALVNHLNRAVSLITDRKEVSELSRLNFKAGERAKAAVAYVSARGFLAQAMALLPDDAWTEDYETTLALALERCECEYLVGQVEAADRLFHLILHHARSVPDRAKAYLLFAKLYQVSGKYESAVQAALEGLALFSVTFPETKEEVDAALMLELSEVSRNLRGRRAAELLKAPRASAPEALAVMGLLSALMPPCYLARPQLYPLVVLKGLNCALRAGNTPESCFAYAAYALLLAGTTYDVTRAIEFSELALELNAEFDDPKLRAPLLFQHGLILTFAPRHFSTVLPIFEQALTASLNTGDLVFAGYNAFTSMLLRVEMGEQLSTLSDTARKHAALFRQSQNSSVYQGMLDYQQFAEALGAVPAKTHGAERPFNEAEYIESATKVGFSSGIEIHYTLQLMVAFLHQDYEHALECNARAEAQKPQGITMALYVNRLFYHALTLAALADHAPVEQRRGHESALRASVAQLETWAERCPENFLNRYALAAAELSRVEQRDIDAMRWYERAIESAKQNDFVHNESLACELAGRFYHSRGLTKNADAHLRDAHAGYLRWGALSKVKQLERQFPSLSRPDRVASLDADSIGYLDLSNIVKASQAVSSEMVLNKLVERLLSVVVHHAGAERALLILPHGEGFVVEAQATTGRDRVQVQFARVPVSAEILPDSVFRYAIRTRQNVILDDASTARLFASDPYIRRNASKSVLCLPLVKQGRIVGVLYLENNLTPGTFPPDRVAVLNVLASQAAISLENARLYSDLTKERSRLQAVIHHVPAGLVIADSPTGSIVSANAQAAAIWRNSKLATSLEEFTRHVGFHADGRPYEPHEWPLARSIHRGEAVENEEVEVLRADGSKGWLSLSSTPIRDADGHIAAGVVMFLDITERKQRERELRLSEERFAKAFFSNPTPMAVVRSPDGAFVDVNENFLRMLGVTWPELLGHSANDLGPAYVNLLERLNQLSAERSALHNEEIVVPVKSGESLTLLVSSECIELEGQDCFLLSFTDMTERKRVEEQLRQSQKLEAIGSLAGGIAHDFNNILTLINGSSELIMMRMPHSDPNYELVESILKTGERAAGLTRKLLAFSRKEVAERRVWPINTIVGDMLALLRRVIEEDVELITKLAPDAGYIQANRGQVEQVLLNLVVNSRDAMPAGGRLKLETRSVFLDPESRDTVFEVTPGPYVMLAVEDTGTGMHREVQTKIFEPFFTTKEVGKGTGLGLAMVYGIVKQAGGNISVTSTVNQGTTVRIYFPRADQTTHGTKEVSSEPLSSLRGTEVILLAEDDDELRGFFARALEAQGYRVLAASNGRKALECLHHSTLSVDLVVTDVIMPDMGGRDLVEQLRREERTLPVVYVSGYTKDVELFQDTPEKAEYFLPKPFGAVELTRKIRDVLENR